MVSTDESCRCVTAEQGATAVEYGLMAGFIAGVIALAVSELGQAVAGSFVDFAARMGW
jgi:Flp pilus assembly pilin Flp